MSVFSRSYRFMAAFMGCVFILCFIAACASNTPDAVGQNTSTPTSTVIATPTPITQPVPPAQTDCPAQGTGRALVTAPLALGSHPQIVYVPTDGNNKFSSNRIVRYDTVTHASTAIIKLPDDRLVASLTLSHDKQWIFFTSFAANAPTTPTNDVQAVRVDGQGLQTLYCGLVANGSTWSPDAHWFAFDEHNQYPGAHETIHLLDTTTGQVHAVADIPQQNTGPFDDPYPFIWLSTTQLYLKYLNPGDNLTHLLDITKGDHQALSTIPVVTQQIYKTAQTDGTSLFLALQVCQDGSGTCNASQVVKSTITRETAQGGIPQTIFTSTQLGINHLAVTTTQKFLLSGTNLSTKTSEIWTINSDGSDARLIASQPVGTTAAGFADNILSDGTQFIVSGWTMKAGDSPQTYIGSLQTNTLTPTAISDTVALVGGWTML